MFWIIVLVWGPAVLSLIGAFKTELYTLAMLYIPALVLSPDSIPQIGYDVDYPHRSDTDDIRVQLTGPLDYGIVYILPSKDYGFNAVYSPKITSEHKYLEGNTATFSCGVDNAFNRFLCRDGIYKRPPSPPTVSPYRELSCIVQSGNHLHKPDSPGH